MVVECTEKCKEKEINIISISTDGSMRNNSLLDCLKKNGFKIPITFEEWKEDKDGYQFDGSNLILHIKDALHICKNLRNIVHDGGGVTIDGDLVFIRDLTEFLEKVIENQNLNTQIHDKSSKVQFQYEGVKINLEDLNPIDN